MNTQETDMIPESPELDAALQAIFDIYGEAGIDELTGRIDGYGKPETTVSAWYASGSIGERRHSLAMGELEGTDIPVGRIICANGQPKADSPEAELQRQANISYFNMLGVLGAFGGFDNDGDGVSDRLKAPRQTLNFPGVGNEWPSAVKARKWADPSVSPSLEGSEVVEGVMVYRDPQAAQESLRLVVAASENGWVTPG